MHPYFEAFKMKEEEVKKFLQEEVSEREFVEAFVAAGANEEQIEFHVGISKHFGSYFHIGNRLLKIKGLKN